MSDISSVKDKLKDLKKIIHFKKIDKDATGSFSTNDQLYQMQGKGKKSNSIFNCSKYFKNLMYLGISRLISQYTKKTLYSLKCTKEKNWKILL